VTALQPHIKREVMPGDLTATDLPEAYIRDAASTYWHQVGTAKMGNDSTSVVDVNRPGMSGDSSCWEGWSHVRWFVEEVSAGAA
jgi:hypothetical protein